ncbi:MAG: exosortase C-terminal domain/associated protein EpsI [Acidobacteriota bacterium]
MSGPYPNTFQRFAAPAAVSVAILFAYFLVITKLAADWWTDENYSHGLLMPFVIGFILWGEREKLAEASTGASVWLGTLLISFALALLAAGTLGAELFTQRISLTIMLAGVAVYFFGQRILSVIAVPIVLLLLAIPIPQIIFNRIAFPLQIWASKIAVWGIRLFDIPVLRNGNVMDILPRGATQTISLEVVEACSGIRSLSTLITLALVLAYFTRRQGDDPKFANFSGPDLWRAGLLMLLAVPIAVLTNAARVTGTGILTYYYGRSASEGTPHEVSGLLVYVAALAILIGVNALLKRMLRGGSRDGGGRRTSREGFRKRAPLLPLLVGIVVCGLAINWFANRGEVAVPRTQLAELPATLGDWRQKGGDFPLDAETLSVLGTTDYTMREYSLPDGRIANIYVGYYASQRTGATYHSPQNCLPGAGWVMSEPSAVEITAANGRKFKANRYLIENGNYREIMIYWYQGRGRIEASEYTDKINTVWDSVLRRRTDGAMIRVMTGVGSDEPSAVNAAANLAASLEDNLSSFIPD